MEIGLVLRYRTDCDLFRLNVGKICSSCTKYGMRIHRTLSRYMDVYRRTFCVQIFIDKEIIAVTILDLREWFCHEKTERSSNDGSQSVVCRIHERRRYPDVFFIVTTSQPWRMSSHKIIQMFNRMCGAV